MKASARPWAKTQGNAVLGVQYLAEVPAKSSLVLPSQKVLTQRQSRSPEHATVAVDSSPRGTNLHFPQDTKQRDETITSIIVDTMQGLHLNRETCTGVSFRARA